jgi:hypothetical protein
MQSLSWIKVLCIEKKTQQIILMLCDYNLLVSIDVNVNEIGWIFFKIVQSVERKWNLMWTFDCIKQVVKIVQFILKVSCCFLWLGFGETSWN